MSTVREFEDSAREEEHEIVLPLHVEELDVSKRQVTKDRIRISTITRQSDVVVSELLARENVEVDRVPIGKPVSSVPPVREEGDTIIIPIVEETLVVERRLIVKEELRVRRVRSVEEYRENVILRKQEAEITRLPAQESAAGKPGD